MFTPYELAKTIKVNTVRAVLYLHKDEEPTCAVQVDMAVFVGLLTNWERDIREDERQKEKD